MICFVLQLVSIKNALYTILHFINQLMPKRGGQNNEENKILGFLLGLAGGTIVYGILSLFQKDNKSYCPVCKVEIKRDDPDCWNCHSKFRWRKA